MSRAINLLVGALAIVPLIVLVTAFLPLLFFWQPGIVGEFVGLLEELGGEITGLEQ